MNNIVLIQISGDDQPGLTASLMEVLAEYRVEILDIGQAVVHNTLSLGMLIRITPGDDGVLKELLFHLNQQGLTVRFTPISDERYGQWVAARGKTLYVITVFGRQVTPGHLGQVARILSDNGLNIDQIHRLSGRVPLEPRPERSRQCVELIVRGEPADEAAMKSAFIELSHEQGVDIAFQRDNVFRRNSRLVVFDMDSTLIQHEVIDELAVEAGVGEEVAAITEAAMRGEIDFKESFRRRLSLLKGLDASVLDKIVNRLQLTEGAERLFANLKALGYKTAIVSGGFTYFGHHLQKKLGIDYVYANELEIENGKITGRAVGDIIDGQRKAELVRELAEKEKIRLEQVIAVGDGANDLPMLEIAGLGIAFHAKPIVKSNARHAISTLGLDGILYLIGLRDYDTIE
ncbi:MAG: phosphoserine phosphatase SerB [Gammaproteobacteria bacterium]